MTDDWSEAELEAFDSFESMRRLIRKPMTVGAQERMITRANGFKEKGANLIQVFNTSEDCNWLNIYYTPSRVRDTTRPVESPESKLAGLEKLVARLKANNKPVPETLLQQIKNLRSE